MEVKPGYKRTEVGVIPEEWRDGTIADLQPYVTSGSRGWAEYYSDRGSAFLRITNLSRESVDLDLSNLRLVDLPPDDNEGRRTQLEEGDLLISITADIGIVGHVGARVPKPAYINQHIALIRFDDSKADSKFVAYFLASERSQKWFKATTDQGAKAGMNLTGIRSIRVAFPRVDEQRAIASALSDVDALLTQLDRLIAKKRDIKQAVMQQLLTGKTRLPGFSGAWLSVKAGEIGRFRGGSGFPTKFQGNGTGTLPFYKVSDMNTPGNEVFMSHANNYIGSEIRAKLSATVFPPMTIVFAKVGAAIFLERKKLLRFASCLDNNMAGYVPEPGITDPRYLHYVFMSTALSDLVSTTALPSLNNRVLASMILRLPPIEEQTAIATLLSELDAELAALEARRDKTRALKQGMMQELLTGRTRLV